MTAGWPAYAAARARVARLGRNGRRQRRRCSAQRHVLRESAPMYFMDAEPGAAAFGYMGRQGLRRLGWAGRGAGARDRAAALRDEIDRLHCADGTIETVHDLHDAGYTLGCVTNTLADTATIRTMLRRHGIEEVMRSVVVSADEGWRKPHRALFEKALRETGAAAHEAVFIGDSPWHDVAGAQAVGMRTVQTCQYVTRPTEGMPEPDAVISHLRELRAIVKRW
jgi:HAD superfamily hydrolase (TIGR01549 family)